MTRATLTPAQTIALQFAGISAPTEQLRSYCPRCSHTRVKHWNRCLKLIIEGDVIHCRCKHCRDEWEIAI